MLEIEKERADAVYSIGELASEFDVTPRAIRFYETEGLLAPRREGQRRIYSPRERTRLKLTLRGKRLGLTLSEIRDLIDMYEPGRDASASSPCRRRTRRRSSASARTSRRSTPRSPPSRSACASSWAGGRSAVDVYVNVT